MESYQRVELKDKTNTVKCSNWELLKRGVPQGSNLGPLFFSRPVILFIMHKVHTVTAKNAKLVLYADDTSLIITNPSHIEFANKLN